MPVQVFANLEIGQISGFEALSRWNDPQRGFVPPGTFIALAEEIGLIDLIGQRILKRACVDIDKSVISDLATSRSSVAIVRTVCGLARSFGASTSAEGVKTDDQLAQIRAEGCTEMQGYFLSMPLPAGEIPALLARVLAARRGPLPLTPADATAGCPGAGLRLDDPVR